MVTRHASRVSGGSEPRESGSPAPPYPFFLGISDQGGGNAKSDFRACPPSPRTATAAGSRAPDRRDLGTQRRRRDVHGSQPQLERARSRGSHRSGPAKRLGHRRADERPVVG